MLLHRKKFGTKTRRKGYLITCVGYRSTGVATRLWMTLDLPQPRKKSCCRRRATRRRRRRRRNGRRRRRRRRSGRAVSQFAQCQTEAAKQQNEGGSHLVTELRRLDLVKVVQASEDAAEVLPGALDPQERAPRGLGASRAAEEQIGSSRAPHPTAAAQRVRGAEELLLKFSSTSPRCRRRTQVRLEQRSERHRARLGIDVVLSLLQVLLSTTVVVADVHVHVVIVMFNKEKMMRGSRHRAAICAVR